MRKIEIKKLIKHLKSKTVLFEQTNFFNNHTAQTGSKIKQQNRVRKVEGITQELSHFNGNSLVKRYRVTNTIPLLHNF